jgi:uncharacterized membrane protein
VDSKAKLFGHSIHQMLIPFPVGLLATAAVFDLLYLLTDSARIASAAYFMTIAGIIGGLAAAPFGLVDWLAIPKRTRAKKIGSVHGLGNVVVLALFAGSFWIRHDRADNAYTPDMIAVALSLLGLALAGITAWLGGELVDRLTVGVDEGAHLNAPSSLSRRPLRGRV